jgi:GntR family carbon starvation induced transcriptional regulator
MDTTMNSSKESPKNKTKSQSIILTAYADLRLDIIRGRHNPGEKLKVEHLKDEYGVSAGSLREALALLVSDSLVVASQGRGFTVAPMSLADLEDLTRTRSLLECEALRESIAIADDNWEASVVAAYYKLSLTEERLTNDAAAAFPEWELRNKEFHIAIVSGCTSHWIVKLRSKIYQLLERYRWLSAVEGPPPSSVHIEHKKLRDAVVARDADGAVAALSAHINHSFLTIKARGLID